MQRPRETVLSVWSSFLLDPILNTSPKPHLQKVFSCRHSCHTWDVGLGTHVKCSIPTSMLSTVEITQIDLKWLGASDLGPIWTSPKTLKPQEALECSNLEDQPRHKNQGQWNQRWGNRRCTFQVENLHGNHPQRRKGNIVYERTSHPSRVKTWSLISLLPIYLYDLSISNFKSTFNILWVHTISGFCCCMTSCYTCWRFFKCTQLLIQ